MNKPVIIIGAGDHAKVLLDILLEQGVKVIGLADKAVPKRTLIYGISVVGDDNMVLRYSPDEVTLVNGIGSVKTLNLRKRIYNYFKEKGYFFSYVIHSSAVISNRTKLCEGCQILAKTVINTEAIIGENTIINAGSIIEHGCCIGNHVHIAPGCTLSGCVKIGDCTHVGTGSSVIQGITIGSNVLLGAGSVVVNDIEDNSKAYGVPAKMKNTIQMMGMG
jgi:sugar O-acyltransferase, sialic acid O-acetyltransferase NeuD family